MSLSKDLKSVYPYDRECLPTDPEHVIEVSMTQAIRLAKNIAMMEIISSVPQNYASFGDAYDDFINQTIDLNDLSVWEELEHMDIDDVRSEVLNSFNQIMASFNAIERENQQLNESHAPTSMSLSM